MFTYTHNEEQTLATDRFIYNVTDGDVFGIIGTVDICFNLINYPPTFLKEKLATQLLLTQQETNVLQNRDNTLDNTQIIYRVLHDGNYVKNIDTNMGKLSIEDKISNNSDSSFTYKANSIDGIILIHAFRVYQELSYEDISYQEIIDLSNHSTINFATNINPTPYTDRDTIQVIAHIPHDYQIKDIMRHKVIIKFLHIPGTDEIADSRRAENLLKALEAIRGSLKAYKYNQDAKEFYKLLVSIAGKYKDNNTTLKALLDNL